MKFVLPVIFLVLAITTWTSRASNTTTNGTGTESTDIVMMLDNETDANTTTQYRYKRRGAQGGNKWIHITVCLIIIAVVGSSVIIMCIAWRDYRRDKAKESKGKQAAAGSPSKIAIEVEKSKKSEGGKSEGSIDGGKSDKSKPQETSGIDGSKKSTKDSSKVPGTGDASIKSNKSNQSGGGDSKKAGMESSKKAAAEASKKAA